MSAAPLASVPLAVNGAPCLLHRVRFRSAADSGGLPLLATLRDPQPALAVLEQRIELSEDAELPETAVDDELLVIFANAGLQTGHAWRQSLEAWMAAGEDERQPVCWKRPRSASEGAVAPPPRAGHRQSRTLPGAARRPGRLRLARRSPAAPGRRHRGGLGTGPGRCRTDPATAPRRPAAPGTCEPAGATHYTLAHWPTPAWSRTWRSRRCN
ncbi:hypothetical protein ACG3SK_04055 [Pseudomonas aeruginosa]